MGYGFEEPAVRRTKEVRTTGRSTAIGAGADPIVRHDIWVRLRPLDYQVVVPLLNAFNQPVSVERLCRDAFGSACSEAELKRLYHCIDRVRPHLAVFGLAITSLSKKRGYMLWRGDADVDRSTQA